MTCQHIAVEDLLQLFALFAVSNIPLTNTLLESTDSVMGSPNETNDTEPDRVEPIRQPDRPPPHYDDDSLATIDPPFNVLPGEYLTHVGQINDGVVIALSDFRVFIRYHSSFVNVPLGLIDTIECRDIFYLLIYCKDAHSIRCVFATNDACIEWYKRLSAALGPPTKITDVFAFNFHQRIQELHTLPSSINPTDTGKGSRDDDRVSSMPYIGQEIPNSKSLTADIERMGFDFKKGPWRITNVNVEYKACKSYPKENIVPRTVTDASITSIAKSFRSSGRFPSVVWRDPDTGVVIARCSQPELGWFGSRFEEDEVMVDEILKACIMDRNKELDMNNDRAEWNPDRRLLIIDARSYTAAFANRAKGGGSECSEYYTHCEVNFMNLANIHAVRKSFQAVRALCTASVDQTLWLSGLESSKWLTYISELLRSAATISKAISKEQRPVMIHCSDGWDRTPQLVSLSQLLLDPYYRKIEGFQILIEREWLAFGHKFADRCGHGIYSDDVNERCPVFLQFLDCIYQLIKQFPSAFEFSDAFLIKLCQHTYSCLFGTFLCNRVQDREAAQLSLRTSSVWSLLTTNNSKFKNHLYDPNGPKVLEPSFHLRVLTFWSAMYLCDTPKSQLKDVSKPDGASPVVRASLTNGTSTKAASDTEPSDSSDSMSANGITNCKRSRSCDRLDCQCDPEERPMPTSQSSHIGLSRQLNNPNVTEPGNSEQVVAHDVLGNGDIQGPRENGHYTAEMTPMQNGTSTPPQIMNGQQHHVEPDVNHFDDSGSSTICNGTEDSVTSLTPECDGLKPRSSIQGSTETLTPDLELNGITPRCVNNPSTDACSTTVSTSTSDLRDPRIYGPNLQIDRNLLQTYGPEEAGKINNGTSKPISNGMEEKEQPSEWYDSNSRTPRLDIDGMVTWISPEQKQMARQQALHRKEMESMNKRLQRLAAIVHVMKAGYSVKEIPDQDDMSSVSDSSSSIDPVSSDNSWEAVDERDAAMTLWMPDHAVTHCADCKCEFWVVKRRHHCRSCGKVFCAECTNQCMPIHNQFLGKAVRVCKECHMKLCRKEASDTNQSIDSFDTLGT